MLTAMELLRGAGAAAIALLVLQQADRGIWWNVCNARSIRTKQDVEKLYETGNNRFLVAAKLIPAALVCFGVGWMVAVDHAVGGLVISLTGIFAFCTISLIRAYRTIGPA